MKCPQATVNLLIYSHIKHTFLQRYIFITFLKYITCTSSPFNVQ